jgi:hypothetical protein
MATQAGHGWIDRVKASFERLNTDDSSVAVPPSGSPRDTGPSAVDTDRLTLSSTPLCSSIDPLISIAFPCFPDFALTRFNPSRAFPCLALTRQQQTWR